MTLIEPVWKETEYEYRSKKKIQRAVGGARTYNLSLVQRVAMLLMYYRTYVSHVLLRVLFNINENMVCKYFKRLNPLVSVIFALPAKKIEITEEKIIYLCADATELETDKGDGLDW